MQFASNQACMEPWLDFLTDSAVKPWLEFASSAFIGQMRCDVSANRQSMEAVFKTYWPELYREYERTMQALINQNPLLQPIRTPFWPFAGVTINCGRRSVCDPHRDFLNLLYGICAAIVCGNFNYRVGGQLVLHEMKQIVEVRPGQMALFPSACITHENIPIGPDETRQSMSLYSAGGLFRYVAYGCRTWDVFGQQDLAGRKVFQEETLNRWDDRQSRLHTISGIQNKYMEIM